MNTKTFSINLLSSVILVSVVFLAAYPLLGGVPEILTQPDIVEVIPVTRLDSVQPSGADETAYVLGDTAWEIGPDDIAAAREAAEVLSQSYASGKVDFDAVELVSGQLDAGDISAARQAAHYLAAAMRISGELDAGDIAAARQAAETLTLVVGGSDFMKPALQKTGAELAMASRFGAPEGMFASLFSAE